MTDVSAGKKVKLSIVPCECKEGNTKALREPVFEAMLNPSSLKHTQRIDYNRTRAQGKSAQTLKFNAMGNDTIAFTLLIDGTGVVEPATAENSVTSRVDCLRQVVYKYEGEQHEPKVVRVLWGTLIFFGRLESMSFDYTLFKPSGEPLRVKVALSFIGTISAKEEALEAKRSSPDLTHEITFKAGDSLPLLCQQIYGNGAYYTAVARYNRITNFRAIQPGTTVFFPPLR